MKQTFILLVWCWLQFGAGLGRAQEPAESLGSGGGIPEPLPALRGEPIPPAPSDMVLDAGDVFSGEDRADFSRKLVALRDREGIAVYLAAYTFVAGETADERARRLCQEWLGKKPGAIIVYEKGGSADLSFAARPDADHFLTSPALREIFTRAKSAADTAGPESPPASRITSAVNSLLADFTAEAVPVMQAKAGLVGEDHWRILAVVLCSMLLCLLLLALVGRHQRKSLRKKAAVLLFPDVEVVPRLGAIHGGGVVACLDVRDEPAPRSSSRAHAGSYSS